MASLFELGSLLALSGCAAVKVKLGMRVYLAKVPVTSMQAHLVNGPAIAPGDKSPLVVQFLTPSYDATTNKRLVNLRDSLSHQYS